MIIKPMNLQKIRIKIKKIKVIKYKSSYHKIK